MSTGKRIAKRSIIGTRVCAPGRDGKFYSGVIQGVTTPGNQDQSNCITLTPSTRYAVKFDARQGNLGRSTAEFLDSELIGPGFQSVLGVELVGGQRCFVTFNGREVTGEVLKHHIETDEVIIRIHPSGTESPFEVQKKLEEVRLLESRKSARLADSDTDFARLADMANDRKRNFGGVELQRTESRKRRNSSSHDDCIHGKNTMDECNAALVLMSLSSSPKAGKNAVFHFSATRRASPSRCSNSSGASFRSTPSPQPSNNSNSSNTTDEGIIIDYVDMMEDQPKNTKSATRIVFQCTFRGCTKSSNTCEDIENHVRNEHKVKPKEEEFYYTEIELGETSPPPTASHADMARPPHEDPDYQRQLVGTYRLNILQLNSQFNFNSQQQQQCSPQQPTKIIKLSSARPKSPKSTTRRGKGENNSKKCRKMYGMEGKDNWCTQCRWKKACARFAAPHQTDASATATVF